MKLSIHTFLLSFILLSCSSASNEENKTESSNPIADYMNLKDALVQTDATIAKSQAIKLVKSAVESNMNEELINAVQLIASSEDITQQRSAFKNVTDIMIQSLQENNIEDGVFIQYCPMAFDNTGANWLSLSEEIRNPYFGDMMLKCGRVVEKL